MLHKLPNFITRLCLLLKLFNEMCFVFHFHTFQPPSSWKREVWNKTLDNVGGTMVAKIFNFRFSETQKKSFSRTFCSLKMSLEIRILHCLCENFLEYPPDIIQTSITVYLVWQNFWWFKSYKLYLFSNFFYLFFKLNFPGVLSIVLKCFVDMDLLLIVKITIKSSAHS